MAEKLRIHQLAKELNVNSKDILAKCEAEGVEVRNHMSTVSAGLAATIREWFSDMEPSTALETSMKVDLEAVRQKKAPRKRKETETPEEQEVVAAELNEQFAEPAEVEASGAASRSGSVAVAEGPQRGLIEDLPEPEIADAPEEPAAVEEALPAPVAEAPPAPPPAPVEPPKPPPIKPAGPQHVPQPAQVQGPRVIRMEAPDHVDVPPRRAAGARYRSTALANAPQPAPATPSRKSRSKTYQSEDEGARKAGTVRPARRGRGSETGDQLREWRDRDLAEREERLRGATGRRAKRRASESRGAVTRKQITEAQVTEPIILKDFCAATGVSLSQLTPKLVNELKILPNINMTLDKETAELLASEFGIELKVVAARSPLDDIRRDFENRERPNLAPRAPVVTFLGHVDHGKTSLLDRVRNSRVTAGEAGGITQHMGSYYLERDGLAVTFLDTPGHEAFTAMRARGAQLTDVVVLVVAADDGIMPQTVEAINHAKAARVPVVVALNKIDLPGVDTNKIYGQLAEHELVPTEWGGNTDVIRTSATQGIGIDELVEHLATLSELLELKADPTIPARGRVIEAQMRTGVGVVCRVLIQDGSLRQGDIVVCGPGFGKVRSMTNDQGRSLRVAGPSMPVEIAGLDELPGAGDEFFQVPSLKQAEQIAEEVKQQRRRDSLITFNKPKSLDDLFGQREAGGIPELNVIIKADVQGSVDVLRKTLGEFPSSAVKLNILHAGVGGIMESDVVLAEASNAIIIGFQVVIADSQVRRLVEERGVDVRLHRVIYNVVDEIKQALEGLLAPEEKFEQRGQAEVREVFRVSKVGMVAGCFIRDGVIARDHRVRVIRDSVIVRDEGRIQSLRRFKDDVREVKAGFECGIKIEGFDDLKPQDIIESYEVIKIARTLS